jgi:hypothetical protein
VSDQLNACAREPLCRELQERGTTNSVCGAIGSCWIAWASSLHQTFTVMPQYKPAVTAVNKKLAPDIPVSTRAIPRGQGLSLKL